MGLSAALNRVLLNLTSNSVKFIKGGTVIVGARELSPARVEFWVQDSGPAIPAQVMEQLFRPFRRSDAKRGRGSHTFSSAGLGLSICHKLVTALGSELRVTTAPEQGTRFHFELELPTIATQER